MSNDKTSIAEQIRKVRDIGNLTKPELAQLLGTSLAGIDRWERGDVIPSPEHVDRISTLLNEIRVGSLRPAAPPQSNPW